MYGLCELEVLLTPTGFEFHSQKRAGKPMDRDRSIMACFISSFEDVKAPTFTFMHVSTRY